MNGSRRSVALVFPACHRRGGVERVVREHARRLAVAHDVTFVGERLDREGMDGIGFVEVPAPPDGLVSRFVPGSIHFRRAAAEVLRSRSFDVTVTFGANCPPGDILVVGSVHRAWLRSSAPIPTRFGSVSPKARYAMPQHAALLAMERSYFRSDRPRWIAPCSDRTGREVIELYGADATIVETLPNGFDPDEFSLEVRTRERADGRRRMSVTDGDVALLFVANELHRKGFAALIDAVAAVDDPRLHVHVVGRVTPEGYAGRIRDLGLDDRVHWHGAQGDVAPWYAAADLLVLPTQYEPFGNVIVEALAMGVPVVTTVVAGASSAVMPGVNGYLQQDATDATELAGLLRKATDPDQLAHLTRHAAEGLERYAWDVLTARLDRMVRTIQPENGPFGTRS